MAEEQVILERIEVMESKILRVLDLEKKEELSKKQNEHDELERDIGEEKTKYVHKLKMFEVGKKVIAALETEPKAGQPKLDAA
jgi:hypothetical protein